MMDRDDQADQADQQPQQVRLDLNWQPPEWITPSAAARWLGVSYWGARYLARTGRLTTRVSASGHSEYLASDVLRLRDERAAAREARGHEALRTFTAALVREDAQRTAADAAQGARA